MAKITALEQDLRFWTVPSKIILLWGRGVRSVIR